MVAQAIGRVQLLALGANLLFIIILYAVASALLRSFFARLARGDHSAKPGRSARLATLRSIALTFLRTILVVSFAFTLLDSFGLDIKGLLLSASVIGVGISLGSQHLFRDLVSGLFILGEGQLNVGDAVLHDGRPWVVALTALRYAMLVNCAGEVAYLPYGQVTTVTNVDNASAFEPDGVPEETRSPLAELVRRAPGEAKKHGVIVRAHHFKDTGAVAIMLSGSSAADVAKRLVSLASKSGVSLALVSPRDDIQLLCYRYDASITAQDAGGHAR